MQFFITKLTKNAPKVQFNFQFKTEGEKKNFARLGFYSKTENYKKWKMILNVPNLEYHCHVKQVDISWIAIFKFN